MRQAMQVEIISKLLARVHERDTELGEGEHYWPVSDYTDPLRFAQEVDMIRSRPNIVAYTGQIARPGDFVTKDVMGSPLLISRDENGQARVFLNVCRHRGSNLVTQESGSKLSRIICPYHGWAYGADGSLLAVPDKSRSFPTLDMRRMGLIELSSEERHGFVWAILTPNTGHAGEHVSAFLGECLDDELAAYGFAEHTFYRHETWRGGFNWKCGVEQFLENYHFAFLHRASTSHIFVPNVLICDRFGEHMRAIAPKKSITNITSIDQNNWNIRPNTTILYTIFPLSIFFIEKNLLSLLQIFPESVGSSRVDVTYIVDNESITRQRFWEENIRLFKTAIVEDLEMCEVMQKGFQVGGYPHVVFGRNESGLHQYRENLEVSLASHRRAVEQA